MIGLGRMGANMVRRLMKAGHSCVATDRDPEAVAAVAADGATGASHIAALVELLAPPRAIVIMVPAGVVNNVLQEIKPLLAPGDILIDGGNSNYQDDILRAKDLAKLGIQYVDMGTSGGVWGLERGYCLMIGGSKETVAHLDPLFSALAPGMGSIPPTSGRTAQGTAHLGYLHCGGNGAGHFVKMIHNGIEYGLMAAYAEGFNILRHADGGKASQSHDAETTPLRNPEFYQFDFNLADIAEVWRRGSVITSWLLDLTATALAGDGDLSRYGGHVSDSGEGRWTVQAAIELGIPAQ
ncbi:MAG TPA: decarboxylating 6-phosphogluconate dehydrogenase, partial [Polyangiaceae bacterium]|nr:decarboxylating 6-phosphogluconate dehydrogenase [Polyangiaceae bacterium]